jgi:type IV secretion system protein VirB9
MKKLILSLLGLSWVIAAMPMPADALQDPRPVATDFRIQTVRYSANEVYKFTGHYGYEASIEFAPDETIQTVSIGDSIAWLVTRFGNRRYS